MKDCYADSNSDHVIEIIIIFYLFCLNQQNFVINHSLFLISLSPPPATEEDHMPLTLPRQGSLSHSAMLAELAERGAIPPPSKRALLAEEHHQRLIQLQQQQHLLMPTAHLKVSSARGEVSLSFNSSFSKCSTVEPRYKEV